MHPAEFAVKGLTWRPARRRTPVITGLDLHIPAGQRLLVAGASGAGKSTLLRALCGVLGSADEGDLTGTVSVDGSAPADQPGHIGLLVQDPLAGVVAETVGRDVAFGLENARWPREDIWPQVRTALRQSHFPYPRDHPTAALSGGETQRLGLAGSLAMDAGALLLDEPTSMLDPAGAESVRIAVREHAAHTGATIVLVEHHLEPWVDFADRLLVLGPRCQVLADGKPHEVLDEQRDFLADQGVWVPGIEPPKPLDVDPDLVAPLSSHSGELVRARSVCVELRNRLSARRQPPTVALDGVDAELVAGRALGVTGPSGAGKSTLVSVLAGLVRPTSGTVCASQELATQRGRAPWRWRSRALARRLAWVPQTPEHGVVARSVREEVLAAGRACGTDPRQLEERSDGLLETFGLSALAGASPYHLSGGEQRRLMVAAAVAHGPAGLLLDEPTVGQDRRTWSAVVGAVAAARSAGAGVAVSTHDMQAVDAVADAVLSLAHGRADS